MAKEKKKRKILVKKKNLPDIKFFGSEFFFSKHFFSLFFGESINSKKNLRKKLKVIPQTVLEIWFFQFWHKISNLLSLWAITPRGVVGCGWNFAQVVIFALPMKSFFFQKKLTPPKKNIFLFFLGGSIFSTYFFVIPCFTSPSNLKAIAAITSEILPLEVGLSGRHFEKIWVVFHHIGVQKNCRKWSIGTQTICFSVFYITILNIDDSRIFFIKPWVTIFRGPLGGQYIFEKSCPFYRKSTTPFEEKS